MENNRIRVNFKVSSKGRVTPEITYECSNRPRNEVLIEATKLLDEAFFIAKERGEKYASIIRG